MGVTSSAADFDALFRGGRPDWGSIEFEIRCSRCGYNLRMLERPRCPECGFEFDWRTMREIAPTGSDFLFEHHWRERPVGSFVKTVLKSFCSCRLRSSCWRDCFHSISFYRPSSFRNISATDSRVARRRAKRPSGAIKKSAGMVGTPYRSIQGALFCPRKP